METINFNNNFEAPKKKRGGIKVIIWLLVAIILLSIFEGLGGAFGAQPFVFFSYIQIFLFLRLLYVIYLTVGGQPVPTKAQIRSLFKSGVSAVKNKQSPGQSHPTQVYNTHTINTNGINIQGVCTIENPYAGVLVVGGAGAGKSKSIIEPIIQQAAFKSLSGVVYDFKYPTLAEYVNRAYSTNEAVTTYFINFDNVATSHRVNPIDPTIMTTATYAREFAGSILQNINRQSIERPDFWSDNSLILLSAVFWFLRQSVPEMCTLPHAISLIMANNQDSLIALLQTNPETADMVAPLATSVANAAGAQTAGVLSSLQVSLNKINTPEIYYITGSANGEDNVPLDLNNPERPAVLTLGNNPSLATTYGPVIGLIMTAAAKLMNQQGKQPSMLLVDEFPTIFLPRIEQIPATARSNKVATILACQDLTQITQAYGRTTMDAIISNLGNQFYGRTTSIDTAQRVSNLFGKADKAIITKSRSSGSNSSNSDAGLFSGNVNYSRGKNTSISKSISFQERHLVQVQDVAQLNTGSFYVQLSEGAQKQGKITVPLIRGFEPLPIEQNFNTTPDDVQAFYLKIKADVKQLLTF